MLGRDWPERLRAAMYSSGCQSVAIKTYDGPDTYSQPFTIPDIKTALAELGPVVVGAWGYHYGHDVNGEIWQVRHALKTLQADFVILNVEDPAIEQNPSTAGHWDSALASLRADWPNASLYFCSHAQPRYHERQPYYQATRYGLIQQPMIYHTAMEREPRAAVEVAIRQFEEYGLITRDEHDIFGPWSAAGGCYDSPGWPIHPRDIMTWAETVNGWGATSHVWWSLDWALDRQDLLAAIRESETPMGKEKDRDCD